MTGSENANRVARGWRQPTRAAQPQDARAKATTLQNQGRRVHT